MLNLDPLTLISRVITLIIAFTVHEFSHAYVAYRFGDTTAQEAGRLTLNPLKHLDPIGSLMLLFAGFGYAKPVPINPYVLEQRNKAGVLWVSIAGPLSNLLMAILAVAILRLLFFFLPYNSIGASSMISSFFSQFIYMNIVLALFNMLPIAPLDGEKVLDYFVPVSWKNLFQGFRQYSSFILIIVAIVLPRFGVNILQPLIGKPANAIFTFLMGL
jgi:Zn-dependent protease